MIPKTDGNESHSRHSHEGSDDSLDVYVDISSTERQRQSSIAGKINFLDGNNRASSHYDSRLLSVAMQISLRRGTIGERRFQP